MAESRPGTAKASNEQEVNVQVLLRCRCAGFRQVNNQHIISVTHSL